MVVMTLRNVGSGCLVISGILMESGMQSSNESNLRCNVPSCNRFAARASCSRLLFLDCDSLRAVIDSPASICSDGVVMGVVAIVVVFGVVVSVVVMSGRCGCVTLDLGIRACRSIDVVSVGALGVWAGRVIGVLGGCKVVFDLVVSGVSLLETRGV
jgi:hypothetical protein